MANWLQITHDWTLHIVKKLPGEFKLIKKRWVVERTLAWINRYRRLSKEYEWKVQTSEMFLELSMIRLILKRLAGKLITSHPDY